MKLYIIGNGFDLAHNLKTSYQDYREYIKKNIKTRWKWEQVLDYYPDDYEFWSDIEFNVCRFDKELFLRLKDVYGFGILDDLLRQIHSSFENFILSIENEVLSLSEHFILDKNARFISFNYTSTLEDVYKVPKENIIYIHNDISGPALDILYNIPNHQPCVIGHSPISGDYLCIEDNSVFLDNEYKDFVIQTTKACESIIKSKNIDNFFLRSAKRIDEVVFYGFSFSITDKLYIKYFFDNFSVNTKVSIYYKLTTNQRDEDCIKAFRDKLLSFGIKNNNISFINCDNKRTI